MTAALEGLRVVDLSWGFAGAITSLVLADFGANVLKLEPPGGDGLRSQPAHALWNRGKKSIVVDLRSEGGRARARALAARADVLIETFRPGVAERLGLGYDGLALANPGLVHTSITGFGPRGPHAHLKAYDGIVLAKIGGLGHVNGMAPRGGPAFPAAPYASFSGAQAALHGTLAALYAREHSGRGQHVETSLVQGLVAHDPWEWMLRIVCEKYPDAYRPAPPYSARGVPNTGFAFRLLVCLTRDGRWLQFSQTSPHLFRDFIEVLGLGWIWDDPALKSAPDFETEAERERFWDMLLNAARKRTVAEWEEVYREHPNVWAEVFRSTREALDHPQMLHNGHVIEVDDPHVGRTRQLGPLVVMSGTPGKVRAPAPDLGAHETEARAWLAAGAGRAPGARALTGVAAPEGGGSTAPWAADAARPADGGASSTPPRRGPLEGVTILELGLWYAAPYGTALLADFGARVIKIEPITGEPMRYVMPVPETGAVKVLQGKESVALDLDQPEGREIVHRIARRADLVLMSYRGGVARRLGVDDETLRRENPRLVYLYAPGYGKDGPCARKPAFAPTIGVASGAALLQAGPSIPSGPDLTLDEIKPASIRLNLAAQAPGNADGCAALGVATALLLGLVARERTGVAQEMLTSMLCTTAYAVSDDAIDYAGKPPRLAPDPLLHGMSALYRLYEASDGWLFLACVKPREWQELCRALDELAPGGFAASGDDRFRTPEGRSQHDAELVRSLARVFLTRPAAEWEQLLTAYDVACAEVAEGPIASFAINGPSMWQNEFLTEVEHPVFGRHRRLAPIARLSATPGEARPAPTLGMHTESVLRELGYDDRAIADLATRRVVNLGG